MRKMGEWMRGQNVEVEEWVTKLDPEKLGLPDEQIDVRLDVQPYLETKGRSWAMHRTQMNPNNSMAQIPEEIQLQWRRYEYFHLAATRVGPDVAGENDLFASVETSKN